MYDGGKIKGDFYESINKMVEYAYGAVFTRSICLCCNFDVGRIFLGLGLTDSSPLDMVVIGEMVSGGFSHLRCKWSLCLLQAMF